MDQQIPSANAQIMDATTVCNTFPVLYGKQIPRDNIIYTVEEMLKGDIHIVTIEGKEEVGKTTLLAQFAKRHAEHTLSVFVRATSRYSSDPKILMRDLCNQAQWMVTGNELPSEVDPDEPFFRNLTYELQRRSRWFKKHFYFVVDGLEGLPEDLTYVREFLLGMLPFGQAQFKFIVTGSCKTAAKFITNRLPCKSFTLSGFTLDETISYFEGTGLSRETVNELFRTFSGVPGYLASVQRILGAGLTPEALLDALPDKIPNPFEVEWNAVGHNKQRHELLALLAFDRSKHTIERLAHISCLSTSDIRALLQPLSFLTVDGQDDGPVGFVSESFRRFTGSKLQSLRGPVREKLIDWLLRRPESDEALSLLPRYLAEADRQEQLLAYLSPDHLAIMIERSQSLSPVMETADLGVSTALKLERDYDLFRFGIQKCAVSELDGYAASKSEVDACMACGDYGAATTLAHGAVLRQDRLRLLAAIARSQREQDLYPEPELLGEIEQLYRQVSVSELGDRLIELASDLLYSRPDLAIQLVEQITPSAPQDRAIDWALARLSIEAAVSRRRENSGMGSVAEDLRPRIKDPAALQFSTTFSFLLGEYTPEDVLREVERFENPSDRLFFLREWAVTAEPDDRTGDVIDYALKLAIRTTVFTTTATDLRQLATPLPQLKDETQLRRLVGVFDTQMGSAKVLGPTEDYVRLQLVLCRSEARYDLDSASKRLTEVFYYVNDLKDLEPRAACLARVLAALPKIDPEFKFAETSAMSELLLQELQKSVRELLDSTADHYSVTRDIIKALSRSKPKLAVEVALSLNTEPRRDLALQDFITTCLREPPAHIPFEIIEETLTLFKDRDLRDESLTTILERLSTISEKPVMAEVIPKVLPFASQAAEVADSSRRCRACAHALVILARGNHGTHEGLVERLSGVLKSSWEAMDDDWDKVEIGFRIASLLAEDVRARALEFAGQTHSLRETLGLDYEVSSYAACTKLAIRAFSGLLPKRVDKSDDYDRLAYQIGRVPSLALRVHLWTDLALRCFRYDRITEAKRIVSNEVNPLLARLRSQDWMEWVRALATAAPALYYTHRKTAIETLRQIPSEYRDVAFDRVIDFINRKIPLSDPYPVGDSKYHISHTEAVDICELLEEFDSDGLMCAHLRNLVDSAVWRHNRYEFARNQREDLADRLARIVAKKLPNPRFIKHDGYKVVALAQIARLRRQTHGETWEQLVTAGRNLPNISDRALVLSILAGIGQSIQLQKEAKESADKIPSVTDRIDRYQAMAQHGYELDSAYSKELLKDAIRLIGQSDDPKAMPIKRRLVDFAYGIDPDLASSLASSIDDDEARIAARSRASLPVRHTAKRQVRLLELKDKLSAGELRPVDCTPDTRDDLPSAAWIVLGALNAARVNPRPVKETRGFVQVAAERPLNEAYPILSWVIENAIQRRSYAEEAKTLLREIFEASMLGCDLAYTVAARTSRRPRITPTYQRLQTDRTRIVRAGERSQALEYLRQWLEEHAVDYLKICDPFFGPKDLVVLQMVSGCSQSLEVSILTSKKHQDNEGVKQPWSEAFQLYWHENISEQDPPKTEIVIVGTRSAGALPIHDRWWLTRGSGLRFGSSFSSLGETKDSEISALTDDEIRQREMETDQYLSFTKRDHLGEKLTISVFSL